MNLQRLNDIYADNTLTDKSDVDNLVQLTRDYPYFKTPFLVLAKYYYNTGHYKFEDTLRQAAIRVKDRRSLYEYIHGKKEELPVAETADVITETEIEQIMPQTEEISESKPTIDDFLSDIEKEEPIPQTSDDIETEPETSTEPETNNEVVETQTEIEAAADEAESEQTLPEEFRFESLYHINQETDEQAEPDIIGEEIATEFSFSRSFAPETQEPETGPETEVKETETSFVTEEEDTAESIETSPAEEEPISAKASEILNLRKYPVYNIEEYAESKSQADTPAIGTEQKDEARDFFSWLEKPKHVEPEPESKGIEEVTENVSPVKDKSDLIDRFIAVNPQITRPKKEFYNPENMAKRSEVPDLEFVSETLAQVYYEQGSYDMALKVYEKLSLQNPSKQAYFADLIKKIKEERK